MNEILTCEGLTKSYQKGTNALDGIDLHIGFGRIVGLLGPNGSGKTTSINCILQLLAYDKGTIELFGEPMTPTRFMPASMTAPSVVKRARNCRPKMNSEPPSTRPTPKE